MEHLTLPTSHADILYVVPCACTQPWDGGDFKTYPARAGARWSHMLPATGAFPVWIKEWQTPTDDRELESFLQSWLFFGLLHEMLASEGLFEESEYHETIDQIETLHTRELNARLKTWCESIKTKSVTEQELIKTNLVHCLHLAQEALRCVCAYAGSAPEAHENFNPAIRDSLVSICATIWSVAEMALGHVLPQLNSPEFDGFCGFDEHNVARLKLQRWCPSVIIRENFDRPFAMRWLMLHMIQPAVDMSHDACTEIDCIHAQINAATYSPRHDQIDCRCELLGPELSSVAESLSNNTFPVLEIRGDSVANVSLHTHSYTGSEAYVALSHIWADGLGNPASTTLRRCQLLRLKILVENIANYEFTHTFGSSERTVDKRKLYIWCDSLLCPIQIPDPRDDISDAERAAFRQQPHVAESRTLKQAALRQMRKVYAEAAYVLVLDQDLQAGRSSEMDYIEVAARIVTSRWMQRLWTFQEGALPFKLIFQFADRPVDIRDVMVELQRRYANNPATRAICSHLVGRIAGLRALQYLRDIGGPDIVSFYASIRDRRVQYPEDEALVTATLLNLDVGEVAKHDDHESRMVTFWTLLAQSTKGVPANIVFNERPRLSTPAYRWAPSTLRRAVPGHTDYLGDPDMGSLGVITPNGLRVQLAAWRLKTGSMPVGVLNTELRVFANGYSPLHLLSMDGTWYTIHTTEKLEGDVDAQICNTISDGQNRKCWLMLDNQIRLGTSEYRQAILGFEVPAEDGTSLFHSQMQLQIQVVRPEYATVMNAAEQHAQALRQLPAFGRLQTLAVIDIILGRILNPLPSFISRAAGRLFRFFFGKSVARYTQAVANELGTRSQAAGQSDEQTQQAVVSIGGMNGQEGNICGYIMFWFFGHVILVEEAVDETHEWIVT